MSKEEKIKLALDTFMLIKRYSNAAREIFLQEFDLNSSQIDILCLLSTHKELTMKQIAMRMSTTPGGITQHTEKLISNDIIQRVYDKSDRRVIRLSFTKKGLTTYKALESKRYEYGKSLFNDFSSEELDCLINLHKKILDKVSPTK